MTSVTQEHPAGVGGIGESPATIAGGGVSGRFGGGPRAILRVPLFGKLLGANVLVAVVGTAALVVLARDRGGDSLLVPAVIALAASVAASSALMHLALEPVARLRQALHRVARGELGVRIQRSVVADDDLLRVGDTVNTLLDDLVLERTRIRQLARETIRGADEERSRIARGLHDSTAQTLAALSLEARTALQHGSGPDLTQQLELIKDLAIDALEEVRDLSHTIHPRVLDDLGLAAALGWLARCTREVTGMHVALRLTGDATHVPLELGCTLFRIAEAALEDAAQGGAGAAQLHLAAGIEGTTLETTSDGVTPEHPTEKWQMLRERLALACGSLTVHGDAAHGTRVQAFVPPGVEIN